MDYIRDHKAFFKKMERAPLSTHAQLLWYKLIEIDNGLFWKEEFQVDNERLMRAINVSSRHTLFNARKELVDAGLLSFKTGKKGSPSTYRLHSIADQEPVTLPPESPEDFLYEIKDDITSYFGYTETLGKELQQTVETIWKEFLPGEKPSEADAREVFNYIYTQDRREDGTVVMSFPKDRKEMLAYAFEIARKKRAINWTYIGGIYQNWARADLHTMQDIYGHEERRYQRRGVS